MSRSRGVRQGACAATSPPRAAARRGLRAALALLLCLSACRGAAHESDRAWRGVTEGGWLVEEPGGAQRLSVPSAGDGTAPDSGAVEVLSALVHGPDPADTRRSDKRVHVAPMPVVSSRGLGFKLTVRW